MLFFASFRIGRRISGIGTHRSASAVAVGDFGYRSIVAEVPRTFADILALPRHRFIDRGLLPDEPGIYFVLYETVNVRLAYLGKAQSIQARWTGHHRMPDLQMLEALSIPVQIAWVTIQRWDLTEAEAALIATFRPPLNNRLRPSRRRSAPRESPAGPAPTCPEIIADYRVRRDRAVEALEGDDVWDACNDADGDLLCPMPYPDGLKLINIQDFFWHGISGVESPERVPETPEVEHGRPATTVERNEWLREVARQIDAWLVDHAVRWASGWSSTLLTEVHDALEKEKGVAALLTFR